MEKSDISITKNKIPSLRITFVVYERIVSVAFLEHVTLQIRRTLQGRVGHRIVVDQTHFLLFLRSESVVILACYAKKGMILFFGIRLVQKE